MRVSPVTRLRLSRARDLLEAIDEPSPSIGTVAHASGISPSHFIRLFEAMFGVTPHQYRIATRLARAKHLLATGRQSVTEVCLDVGFSSLGSFSTLFARRFGESPSRFARRIRAQVQVPADLARILMPGCLGLMAMLPAGAFRDFREA